MSTTECPAHASEIRERTTPFDRRQPRDRPAAIRNNHLASLLHIIQQIRQILSRFSHAGDSHSLIVSQVALQFQGRRPCVSDQGSAAGGQTDSISFGGMSENYKSVWLECVDFNDEVTGGGSSLSSATRIALAQEVIQEFQVMADSYSAEFGRSASGARSGATTCTAAATSAVTMHSTGRITFSDVVPFTIEQSGRGHHKDGAISPRT
jgi:hypothetical protein